MTKLCPMRTIFDPHCILKFLINKKIWRSWRESGCSRTSMCLIHHILWFTSSRQLCCPILFQTKWLRQTDILSATRNADSRPYQHHKQKSPTQMGEARLFGGAGGSRTRVRKSSAFGSTCLAKSLNLTARYPTGREDVRRAQLGFSELALNIPHRDLMRVDPGDLHAQAHVRPRALRQVFKLLVRSCRRWQL